MSIFVLNCGAGSVKFALFEYGKSFKMLLKGSAERIGLDQSYIELESENHEKRTIDVKLENHKSALQIVLKQLNSEEVFESKTLDCIGHRVVHGGSDLRGAVEIDEDVLAQVREYSKYAPLHNPANIAGIEACQQLFPGVPNIAMFDTGIFADLPERARIYAIPKRLSEKYQIRRFGFQGISHKYVAEKTADILGKPLEKLKLITCHLGNGCSVAAFDEGKAVETSMGMTPLEGLVMASRSGDIDPAVIIYLIEKTEITAREIDEILNHKSGLLGLCGKKDMRDILEALKNNDKAAERAIDIFVHRIKKYLGAYIAILNGLDAVVFTAGIGENCPDIREKILDNFGYIGLEIDKDRNRANEFIISRDNSKVSALTVKTNEEMAIAQQAYKLLEKK